MNTLTSKDESKAGYITAFKSTLIFGGTQVVTILVNLVKSKIIAVWLGSYGMGLLGIYNTVVGLFSNCSNLGLQSSVVRDIARTHSDDELAHVVKATNRWVFWTGILGMAAMICMSSLLCCTYSLNNTYILSFIALSLVVLFNAMGQQKASILQGKRALKYLVKANVYSVLISFLLSVPLYYFLNNSGIVASLVLSSIIVYLFGCYYVSKLNITNTDQKYSKSFSIGLESVKLGIAMSLSLIAVSIVEFCIRSFITNHGDISEVGLYTAGFAINSQYLGVVFTAMAKDYYPRLAQQSHDNNKMSTLLNEQSTVALIILGPLITIMISIIEPCISILYSEEFLLVVPMVLWLLVGSFVKSGAWGISFIFLAKGDSKVFLFNELGIKLVTLPSYLLGYYYGGLIGLGYAFLFSYIVYFILVAIVSYKQYKIHYNRVFFKIFFILLSLILTTLIAKMFISEYLSILFACFSTLYCIYEFNKRISLIQIYRKLKK